MVFPPRWTLILGVVLLAAGGLYAASERTPAPNHNEQLAMLMMAKLASSQKVVAGLVSEDFEQIRKGGEELHRICEATEWAAHHDQVYAHYRTELSRQAQKLIKMAGDRNLDGASFAYMHSLTTCINCHQHCRDVLKIADEAPMLNKIVPIPVTEDSPAPESVRR